MLAEHFTPTEIECLLRTAGELCNGASPDDLSEAQQNLLGRAGDSLLDDREGPAPSPALTTTQVPNRVWVLRRWDRHADEVTLWPDENTAMGELAGHVRAFWDNVGGLADVLARPPADDRRDVALYYGPEDCRDDEGYALYTDHVNAPTCPAVFDAEACDRANRAAVFHPQTAEGARPCIEVGGVLAFLYLDSETRSVHVSVHLDTTDEQLVRSDQTVPLRVVVEGAAVFDDSGVVPSGPELAPNVHTDHRDA